MSDPLPFFDPFRVRDDGGRSYAAEADSLVALLDEVEADWRGHLPRE